MRGGSRVIEGGRGVILVLAGLVAFVAAACGTSNAAACNAGDLLTCACLSGASGTQACDANGNYGPCSCNVEAGVPEAGEAAAPEGGGNEAGGNDLPYMAVCTVVGTPGDCSPKNGGECFDFPNRGHYCTHPCTANSDCALPSTGCNGMGVCKAPDATAGGGAGTDAGDQ